MEMALWLFDFMVGICALSCRQSHSRLVGEDKYEVSSSFKL